MSKSPTTTKPRRLVTKDEVKALVTVETASRLAARAHRVLSDLTREDEEPQPEVYEALLYLEAIVDRASTRMSAAVNTQSLREEVSAKARKRVDQDRKVIEVALATEDPAEAPLTWFVAASQVAYQCLSCGTDLTVSGERMAFVDSQGNNRCPATGRDHSAVRKEQ